MENKIHNDIRVVIGLDDVDAEDGEREREREQREKRQRVINAAKY